MKVIIDLFYEISQTIEIVKDFATKPLPKKPPDPIRVQSLYEITDFKLYKKSKDPFKDFVLCPGDIILILEKTYENTRAFKLKFLFENEICTTLIPYQTHRSYLNRLDV